MKRMFFELSTGFVRGLLSHDGELVRSIGFVFKFIRSFRR